MRNVMTSSDAKAWNNKHILLNNVGSKHSLVMKFGQLKKKNVIQNFCEKCCPETSSRPFFIFKEHSVKRNVRRRARWFGQILIVLQVACFKNAIFHRGLCLILGKWYLNYQEISGKCLNSIELQLRIWRRGVVVIAAAQLHWTKSELRFCVGSNPARGVSEVRDGISDNGPGWK